MIHKRKTMSCEQFSARMAQLIAAGEDLFAHPHVRHCKLHRALLEDLEEIARAAKQMFPEVDPPDALWDGIQARLAEEFSVSILSDPWPGGRVVFHAKVVEGYNPQSSPPFPRDSVSDGKSAGRLNIIGDSRTFVRRERRR